LNKSIQSENLVRLKNIAGAGPKTPEEVPDYKALREGGIDTVLEIRIAEMGFDGCGKGFDLKRCWDGSSKPAVYLFIRGQARLVRVADDAELHKSAFGYKSAPHEFAEWAENNARLMADELEFGYRDIAESINDKLFLLTSLEIPVPSVWYPPGHELGMVCWLYPVYPKIELRIGSFEGWKEVWKADRSFSYFPDPPFLSAMLFATVDSLSPELCWTCFPRDLDRKQMDPAVLNGISEVAYDLKIWEAVRGSRGRVVYEKTGLGEPRHRLEKPLAPDRQYFWTFRARFRYGGQLMVTHWALWRPMSLDCNIDYIPDQDYYRFRTPKEKASP
jgi:hypothetical protein